jgi:hypothetical protein
MLSRSVDNAERNGVITGSFLVLLSLGTIGITARTGMNKYRDINKKQSIKQDILATSEKIDSQDSVAALAIENARIKLEGGNFDDATHLLRNAEEMYELKRRSRTLLEKLKQAPGDPAVALSSLEEADRVLTNTRDSDEPLTPEEIRDRLERAETELESAEQTARNAVHSVVYDLWDDGADLEASSVNDLQNVMETDPGTGFEILPHLLQQLPAQHEQRERIHSTLVPLVEHDPQRFLDEVSGAVDLFVTLLQNEEHRERAIVGLQNIAEADPEIVEPEMDRIVSTLENDVDALDTITREFPEELAPTPAIVDELVTHLRDEGTRPQAIAALERISELDQTKLEDHVTTIAAALTDDDSETKRQTCRVLKLIGTDDAIARLRDARRETDDFDFRADIEDMIQEAEDERREQTMDADALQSDIPQPDTPDTITPGAEADEELPDHEVLEPIGSGGNADVKKIQLTDSGKIAALKIPRWQGTLSESVIDEFSAEAATWARIDDHEHIIDVLGSGATPYPWILLEYMPDGSLRTQLNRNGQAFAPGEGREVLLALCGAIRHAHRHGIVHADLKPENVLFDGDTPKIGDWGLAKVLLEHSKSIEGMTPTYAAPEQLDPDQYGSVDDQTDVYQIGVMAYELLTGTVPYDRDNPAGTITAILSDDPTPPTEHNPELPPEIDEIILTAMAKEKATRYESVLYVRDALRELDL